ncbi:hypothetical protein ERO13_A12G044900v2 [Gossypium hirsutum]|uniref:Uncharacterized protein isoform X3 n=1 Tax=Gossypium hirsutum TaxID=3635 RepID=A0A1U8LKI2_GOSHI|nr:uncharacterized protein LOC107928389 isoform X3 [Gossypium hirsutum]XP_040938565.1 uncharacterized protein LOC107928389 isoform X3 [Gossypium hirsutum]KAG4168764.1 hypothetical protein ERO13_A12G044900v2 [Gossypium hirsutum]
MGSQVLVPFRGSEDNPRHLKLMGDFGQIVPMKYDPRDENSIKAVIAKANVVIKLIGREYETRNFSFEEVNHFMAEQLAVVKIVKCTVNDIPVDISFNQTAGLSALCFLEKVDQLIGKDHIFKRSNILIKAWCYYESRILGAHHGLISTYALETMILYIINVFHSSLFCSICILLDFLCISAVFCLAGCIYIIDYSSSQYFDNEF